MEIEGKIKVTRNWVGRVGSYCLIGRVSVWSNEKVLEIDSGDGYMTWGI